MFTKKYEDVIELLKIKDDIDKTRLKKLGFVSKEEAEQKLAEIGGKKDD